jgi:hypothetical protein
MFTKLLAYIEGNTLYYEHMEESSRRKGKTKNQANFVRFCPSL